MSCIFCKIIERQSPAEIIYEDAEILSFLDIRPMNYGHTLVIPKVHSSSFFELETELIPALFTRAQRIAKAIQTALAPDGLNLIMNNGRAAGQSVFHCHLHLIPRFSSDAFRFSVDFKNYRKTQFVEFGNLIRKSL